VERCERSGDADSGGGFVAPDGVGLLRHVQVEATTHRFCERRERDELGLGGRVWVREAGRNSIVSHRWQ
jgi:hypothetical protein